MTSSIKPPNPRRELDALDRRIYELERRITRDQTNLKDAVVKYSSTVVTETTYGQASAVGVKRTWAREDHTHGTPAALTALPPNGPAGGDLAGTYPNPTLAVDRVRITGTETITGVKTFSGGTIHSGGAKSKYISTAGTTYSIGAYSPVANGGPAGGLVVTNEVTGQTQFATCDGSAFIDVGPKLLQSTSPSGGKRIRFGVVGDGTVNTNQHQIIFSGYVGGGSAATIITREDNGARRELVLDSGQSSTFNSAAIYLQSGLTGDTREKVLVFGDLTMGAGKNIRGGLVGLNGGFDGMGNGVYSNRGITGGALEFGYDATNGVANIAAINENVSWRNLQYYAATHRFFSNGGSSPILEASTLNVTSYAGSGNTYDGDNREFRAYKDKVASVTTVAGLCGVVPGWAKAQLFVDSSRGDEWQVVNAAGTVHAAIRASAFTVVSARKTKLNIRSLGRTDALSRVKNLNPVRFRRPRISKENPNPPLNVLMYEDTDYAGLIAEEVGLLIPEAVTYGPDLQPDGVDYAAITSFLLGAVQELAAKVDVLELKTI